MLSLITPESNELFPIDGRELHEQLEVATPYTMWFDRMCEYGFSEGSDFNPNKNVRVQKEGNREVSREVVNHDMTLSMAKEICMLQRTEKGRQIRRYLITVEEQWNTPDAVIARALQMANRKMQELTGSVRLLEAEVIQRDQIISELKPKADYVDHILSSKGTMTISQIAADYNMSGNRLNKILHEEGLQRRVGDQWILYVDHMGKGFTESETIEITHSDGRPGTKMFTRWTQKGRLKINEVLNARGIFAVGF